MHITASVFINDAEDGLLQDYALWLEKLCPHAPTSQCLNSRSCEDNAYAAIEVISIQLLPMLRADSVGSIERDNHSAKIRFTGYDGYPYAVERSFDLVHWKVLNINRPKGGEFEFLACPVRSSPVFYRSVLLPDAQMPHFGPIGILHHPEIRQTR